MFFVNLDLWCTENWILMDGVVILHDRLGLDLNPCKIKFCLFCQPRKSEPEVILVQILDLFFLSIRIRASLFMLMIINLVQVSFEICKQAQDLVKSSEAKLSFFSHNF